MDDVNERLASIPARHAQPDPSTLATLPRGGTNLVYMGHAEVTLALIDADPQWTWEPVAMDLETGGPRIIQDGNLLILWGYLTVCGVRRLCVGTCEARKAEHSKELVGDLLRNGAMRFGIGTKLWSKAIDADPGSTIRQAPAPARTSPNVALFDKVKRCAGTELATELKQLAAENGRRLTLADLDADPEWAAIVAAVVG
jgi:hypothetical protein